jgi:Lrp/AsnC family transcriptional regulator, leucine-responsive regulatory protein
MGQDDLDQRILTILQSNGKVSIEDMAVTLDRSPSTIRDRVRRMEDERLILGYSTIVDQERMDVDAEAFVLADIDANAEPKAISALMSLESVSEVMKMTGEPRLMFRVHAANRRELLQYLDRNIRPLGFHRLDVRLVLDRTIRYPGFV